MFYIPSSELHILRDVAAGIPSHIRARRALAVWGLLTGSDLPMGSWAEEEGLSCALMTLRTARKLNIALRSRCRGQSVQGFGSA